MTEQDREALEAHTMSKTGEPSLCEYRTREGYRDWYLNARWQDWLAALAHRDKQIADLQRQRDELVEAGKLASVELAYLIEQVKAKPGGSVCRAKAKLDAALAAMGVE